MKSEENDIPRREFLKFTAAFTSAATAYAVYMTTDAKLQAMPAPVLFQGGGGGSSSYQYM